MIHLGDITKISGYDAPTVSVVIGGSPCQDLSVAGKRAGFDWERSVLFLDQIRVIKEMRKEDEKNGRTGNNARPRFMVWENVPGAFSSKSGEDFRAVLEETARVKDPDAVIPRPADGKWRNAGVILGDGWSIAWRVLDAQFWGVPQRRRRIALVADFGGHAAPEILFERGGVSGDSETGGTAGQGTAGDAENCAGTAVDGVKCLTPWDTQNRRVFSPDGCMSTYNARERSGQNSVAVCLNDQGGSVMGVSEKVAGTLRAQEHGHQPAVCYSFDALASNSMKSNNPHSGCREVGISKTLDYFDPNPSKNQGGIAVVQPIVYNEETITSKTNASNPVPGDPCHTLGATGAGRAICIQGNCIDRADTAGCNGKGWRDDDVSFTLNTIDRPAVYAIENHPADSRVKVSDDGVVQTLSSRMGTSGGNVPMTYQAVTGPLMANSHPGSYTGQDAYNYMLVAHTIKGCGNDPHREDAATYPILNNTARRLTPLECERLQGYPDGWTNIGEWVDSKGKKHISSDSARYKALGNSIALPPWRYVLGKLIRYCEEKTMASLFDGIGGFPLIWGELGGETLWASEIEEFPIAVTKRRFGG